MALNVSQLQQNETNMTLHAHYEYMKVITSYYHQFGRENHHVINHNFYAVGDKKMIMSRSGDVFLTKRNVETSCCHQPTKILISYLAGRVIIQGVGFPPSKPGVTGKKGKKAQQR